MLAATRPTAVNLRWALERMLTRLRNTPPAERVARRLCRGGRHRRRGRGAVRGDRPARRCALIAGGGARRPGRRGERADALQRRLAGDGGLGHRAGADLPGARCRHRRACLGGRDAPAQPGRGADRVGTRQARRAAHRDRGQRRRAPDAARRGRSGDRRHRPGDAHRRRGQQDRHLPEGAGGARQRRAVLGGAAVLDDRLDGGATASPRSRSRSATPPRSPT